MLKRRWILHKQYLGAAWSRSQTFTLFQSSVAGSTHSLSPVLLGRARAIVAEHDDLSKQLSNGYDGRIAKKVGQLSETVQALNEWESANNSLSELQQLLRDSTTDQELRSLAAEEIDTTSGNLPILANRLQSSLVPAHPFAQLPCLVEIRPGAGGSEAGLFAGDLLRMYQAYCKRHGLRVTLLKLEHEAVSGGESDNTIKEAVIEIDSTGAYDLLRCEAGVHRVQRVPATESKGRTHTSAVAVIVMPNFTNDGNGDLGEDEFKDPNSDYFIDPSDVRTDLMRASGAGGQHVNKTESAIRLTHIPTGTVVGVQESRSQHQNRAKAWQILRAKLAQARREAREEELAQLRFSVVGAAKMGRGDKVRTYNWGQQRVTDHRSGITLHHLDDTLQGGDSLDKLMHSVKIWLKEQELEAMIANEKAALSKSDRISNKQVSA